MNFTCEYTTPMDFEPLNLSPASEFPLEKVKLRKTCDFWKVLFLSKKTYIFLYLEFLNSYLT